MHQTGFVHVEKSKLATHEPMKVMVSMICGPHGPHLAKGTLPRYFVPETGHLSSYGEVRFRWSKVRTGGLTKNLASLSDVWREACGSVW